MKIPEGYEIDMHFGIGSCWAYLVRSSDKEPVSKGIGPTVSQAEQNAIKAWKDSLKAASA